MNSLAYISRQFDVLLSPRTPPSTPVTESPPFLRRRGSDSYSLIRTKSSPSYSFLAPDSPSHTPSHSRPKRSYSSPSGFFPPPLPSPPPLPVDPATPPQARLRLRSAWRRIFLVRVFVLAWNALCTSWTSSTSREIEGKAKDAIVGVSTQEKSLHVNDESSPSPFPSIPQFLTSDTLHSAHHPLSKTDVSLPTLPPSPISDSVSASQPHPPSPPAQDTTSRVSTPTTAHKTPFHLPKTLVLDLDETLIHSTSKPLSHSSGPFSLGFGRRNKGHTVEVVLGGRSTLYHVYKRPFVDYFLRKVMIFIHSIAICPLTIGFLQVSSWYTLVVFTASMQEYADPVIDWLDAGHGILTRRLFREVCPYVLILPFCQHFMSSLARSSQMDHTPRICPS